MKVISIVGFTNSGKTTFIVKLLKKLKQQGKKVASIKYNAHNFKMDHPGKDSYKHKQAGAQAIIVASSSSLALIKDLSAPLSAETIIRRYLDNDYDLVIVEGCKHGDLPKIEIYRPDLYEKPIFNEDQVLKRITNDCSESLFDKEVDLLIESIKHLPDF